MKWWRETYRENRFSLSARLTSPCLPQLVQVDSTLVAPPITRLLNLRTRHCACGGLRVYVESQWPRKPISRWSASMGAGSEACPSLAVMEAAIAQNAQALAYITDPPESVILAAVKKCANAVRLVISPSLLVIMAAIANDGDILRYIRAPPREVVLAAVTNYGIALSSVPNPSVEICPAAVKNDGRALRFVPDAAHTPQVALAAVKKDGLAVRFVAPALQSPALFLAAVTCNGQALDYIPADSRTPEILFCPSLL